MDNPGYRWLRATTRLTLLVSATPVLCLDPWGSGGGEGDGGGGSGEEGAADQNNKLMNCRSSVGAAPIPPAISDPLQQQSTASLH